MDPAGLDEVLPALPEPLGPLLLALELDEPVESGPLAEHVSVELLPASAQLVDERQEVTPEDATVMNQEAPQLFPAESVAQYTV